MQDLRTVTKVISSHLHLLYTVDLTIRMATLPIQFINVVKNIYTSYGISNYTYGIVPIQFINVVKNIYISYGISNYTDGNFANLIHQCSEEHLHLLW
jgi:hypothetical protein